MKVGILTFHNAYNYGAVLQTYATQEYVRGLGHEVEVIDYHNRKIDLSYENRKFRLRSFLRNSYIFPLYLLEKYYYWKRRKAYRIFFEKYISLSSNRYEQDDKIFLGDYDVVLIGSDQLWNKKLTGGLDAIYWGQFETRPTTRIAAWSVCMNYMVLTETEKDTIKSYLSNFTAISVREDELQNFISKLTTQEVHLTLDPTLLLTRTQWTALCRPIKEKGYVVVYAVRKEKETVEFARKIAEKQGKPLVILRPYSNWYFTKENKEYGGPVEFLSYINNADMVVTSSFHGTVFSYIFHKQFICPILDGNVRVENLLRILGLRERMVESWNDALNLSTIDYSKVSKTFEAKREETKEYLNSLLSGAISVDEAN